jgi:hypothetical protein
MVTVGVIPLSSLWSEWVNGPATRDQAPAFEADGAMRAQQA